VLLAEALHISKEKLYASLTDVMEESACRRFEQYLDLRLTGRPVSYIRGRKEFYGLEFKVDERVLVPRPETEVLVETVLNLVTTGKTGQGTYPLALHDTCTGSGCIAITLKQLLPQLQVSASDLSAPAGEIFVSNSQTILGITLPFIVSDMLADITGPFDIITANPPYLTHAQTNKMKSAGWPEPALALDGGPDGLDPYRKLISQAWSKLNPGGMLIMEADPEQMPEIGRLLLAGQFRDVQCIKDLTDSERVIYGTKQTCIKK
jgi:release factor glutamine methyltransferase